MKQNYIFCVGEILWDFLPEGKMPGGAPVNVARHLHKMGQQVKVASSVGRDTLGDQLLGFLKHEGISRDLIQQHPHLPTSTVHVTFDAQYEVTYDIVEPVAWDSLEFSTELKADAEHAKLIVYGTLASRSEHTRDTISTLLDTSARKLIDVNLRPPYDRKAVVEPLLERADIAKLNEDELLQVTRWKTRKKLKQKEQIKRLADHYNLEQVLVSRGARGAALYYHDTFYQHTGYRVEAADPVGAGDAFLAGYIASYLNEETPAAILTHASAAGALVASKTGAVPNYDLADLEALKNQRD